MYQRYSLFRHIYCFLLSPFARRVQSYGSLARHMKVMDESFPLPGRGAELNWKILFIPHVCRRRIRFIYNWFNPGEGGRGYFCRGKAKVFLLIERDDWICLVSCIILCLSLNQIISLCCQRTLCATQSVHLQKCFFSSLFSSLFVSVSCRFLKVCLAATSSYHTSK